MKINQLKNKLVSLI